MSKKLWELSGEIVAAQASATPMTDDEVEMALKRTFKVLQELEAAEERGRSGEETEPSRSKGSAPRWAMPRDPRESVGETKVVCLECGAEFRQLTANHLKTHDLTPREYKKKWGFRLKDSLAARELTRRRSAAAKERGIPENLRIYLENRRKAKS